MKSGGRLVLFLCGVAARLRAALATGDDGEPAFARLMRQLGTHVFEPGSDGARLRQLLAHAGLDHEAQLQTSNEADGRNNELDVVIEQAILSDCESTEDAIMHAVKWSQPVIIDSQLQVSRQIDQEGLVRAFQSALIAENQMPGRIQSDSHIRTSASFSSSVVATPGMSISSASTEFFRLPRSRREARPRAETSTPSTSIVPPSSSTRRKSARMIEDLPAPVRPTTPVFCRAGTTAENVLSASGSPGR